MPHPDPAYFEDSIKQRAFPHRFRQVGNPFAFLANIGLIPMLEYLYKGNTLIDLAHEMDVSVTNLRRWIKEEGYESAVEEAESISAEGYLAKAAQDLRNARTDLEFKKAKEALAHARFMASKKDRGTYGGDAAAPKDAGTGVTFVLNMGGHAPPQVLKTLPVAQPAPQEPPQQLVVIGLEDVLGPTPEYLSRG